MPDQMMSESAVTMPAANGADIPTVDGQKPTPEQQTQFELFVTKGQQVVGQTKDLILKQIGAQDPIDGMAQATVMVLTKVEGVALGAGEQLDPYVELAAANHILGEIIKVYEDGGGKPLTDEQKYQAFSFAISTYIEDALKTGKITKEELQAMSEMMQESEGGQKIAQGLKDEGGGQQPAPAETQPAPSQQPAMQPGLLGG